MDQALLSRVAGIMRRQFRGARPELVLAPNGGRICGIVVWNGFKKEEPIERQQKLLELLRGALARQEFGRVGAIFASTPQEARFVRENAMDGNDG